MSRVGNWLRDVETKSGMIGWVSEGGNEARVVTRVGDRSVCYCVSGVGEMGHPYPLSFRGGGLEMELIISLHEGAL